MRRDHARGSTAAADDGVADAAAWAAACAARPAPPAMLAPRRARAFAAAVVDTLLCAGLAALAAGIWLVAFRAAPHSLAAAGLCAAAGFLFATAVADLDDALAPVDASAGHDGAAAVHRALDGLV